MNEYMIEFSYIRDGRRVYERDIITSSRVADAADDIRREYSDLPGLRIERVYIDAGRCWESRDFDY